MGDPEASEAARSLNRARWGDSRPRRLVAELREWPGELPPDVRAALRELAEEEAS